MRSLKTLLIVTCLLGPAMSQAAEAWSSCQTITAVVNYMAYNNAVALALTPGIAGCNGEGPTGGITFLVGIDGVTSTNINGFLATSLGAYVAGKQVMIYYDTSVTGCAGVVIAVGGDAGQC
jgi:hypothetical protein